MKSKKKQVFLTLNRYQNLAQRVEYTNLISQISLDYSNAILFIDDHFKKNSLVLKWSKKFQHSIFLKPGESLKSLSSFEKTLKYLHKLNITTSRNQLTFVALGGGSVGDFVGFISSVYKRGVTFVNIPSTWLAAIDSAHGGKTAINLDRIKNQIGTFYPADRVIICKKLLLDQTQSRAQEAAGELYKIALITGGSLWQSMKSFDLKPEQFYKLLKPAILAKYKIVQKDLFEVKDIRSILNLGHTIGHTHESYFKIPHGVAVGQGLIYALRLSYRLGKLKPKDYLEILSTPYMESILTQKHQKVPTAYFKKILIADKKMSGDFVKFVFISKPGKVFVQKIQTKDLIDFYANV